MKCTHDNHEKRFQGLSSLNVIIIIPNEDVVCYDFVQIAPLSRNIVSRRGSMDTAYLSKNIVIFLLIIYV